MVREAGRSGTDRVVTGMLRTFSAYKTAFRLGSTRGGSTLLRSSRILRSGTDRPPFTSPLAVSPTIGALEKSPGRAPLGSGPLGFSAGCKLAIAMSTLALPAVVTGPGGAFGGGAMPFENAGVPTPSGKTFLALDVPTIDASGIGTSAVWTGIVSRASRFTGGG